MQVARNIRPSSAILFAFILINTVSGAAYAQTAATGGILETATTALARPTSTAPVLPARGRFTFPAPYGTQGIRLTNASDCLGADCVISVGYSYWRNMNNHVGSNTLLAVLTLDRRKGGGGPTLFSYDKTTGQTLNAGPLFAPTDVLSWATGEGWYFSATLPTALYLNDGPRLVRYDVLTRASTVVFDLARYGGNRVLWQMHSSNNDAVHSFTVRGGADSSDLGCGVFFEQTGEFRFFPARGEFDECQVDKSGRFLVIKENVDGLYAEDNVIEDLTTGVETILPDQAGAMGHSDLGFGYGVGEDNWNALPGAVRVWRYDQGGVTDGRVVFQTTDWSFGSMHIAHSDARDGVPLEQQVACNSNASRLRLAHTNEIVCYRLDGSMQALVVAPVMTNLDASGGGTDDYAKEPKGNLDVTGEYFLWTSNMGGARQDAFIVRVPLGLLNVAPGGGAPSDGKSTTSSGAAPVIWTNLVNATSSGTTIRKTGGCAGCADAAATSSLQITSGDGYVEFSADSSLNREIGLSPTSAGTSGDEIQFGLRLRNGTAEVRERGAYRADVGFTSSDRLRIAVVGSRVAYIKNGTPFYTSILTAAYPLLVDTSFNDLNAELHDAVLGGASLASVGGTAAKTASPGAASWANAVNVTLSSSGIRKSSGCDGCPDAGAVSVESLSASSSSVEFVAGAGLHFVGLTATTAGNGLDLPFAFRIGGGTAEVREFGAYRAETSVAPSDILRIAITHGVVQYSKNGAVFHTSSGSAGGPLRIGVSIYSLGDALTAPTIRTD